MEYQLVWGDLFRSPCFWIPVQGLRDPLHIRCHDGSQNSCMVRPLGLVAFILDLVLLI